MDPSPAAAELNRETFAAPVAAPLQDRAAASGAHPLAESVDLLPAAVVRLKGALHSGLPRRKGWRVTDTSVGVYPRGPRQSNRKPGFARPAPTPRPRPGGLCAPTGRAVRPGRTRLDPLERIYTSSPEHFCCVTVITRRNVRRELAHAASDLASRACNEPISLRAPMRAPLHPGDECCDHRCMATFCLGA